jgi:hypothetical protein
MPTTLHTLFRFMRHDGPNATCSASWSVSAGTLEMETRLYRIMYKDGKDKYEEELTIPLRNYKQILYEFYSILKDVISNDSFCKEFRDACHEMIHVDPWLQELDL